MQSQVIALAGEAAVVDPGVEPPDLVLALLEPCADLRPQLEDLRRRWPTSRLVGCEAVTQFLNAGLCRAGLAQLFRFEHPGHRVEISVLRGGTVDSLDRASTARLVDEVCGADAVLVLVDGLRFPVAELLDALRSRAADLPVIVGGLASQEQPIRGTGARVFADDELLDPGCLVVRWYGVEIDTEIVCGWSPASPEYQVTRAAGNVLYEIDGEPATEWYRRVFTVDGALAPLPETAYRFPLIVQGPQPERTGVFRSMQAFDDPPGAVRFWGDLGTGDAVRLGMGNETSLVRTAEDLVSRGPADAAVLFSCVGREVVLGARAEAEVQAIHSALGGLPLAGFFTFGEIGPTAVGTLAFYNQTAVLALLREVPPS